MAVSFNPFSRCCKYDRETTPLDHVFPLLQRAGLHTPEYCQHIQTVGHQKIVEYLSQAQCLTGPNLNRLLLSGGLEFVVAGALASLGEYVTSPILELLFSKPEHVLDTCLAIDHMHKTGLINKRNLDLFSLGGDVAIGLALLASKGLLTQKNLDAVIVYPWMGRDFTSKMIEFDEQGNLRQEILDPFLGVDVVSMDLDALTGECTFDRASGRGHLFKHVQCSIRLLCSREILTPGTRRDVLACPEVALPLVTCYGYLEFGRILTPPNQQALRTNLWSCVFLASGFGEAAKIHPSPAQFVTQELFDCLCVNPKYAPQLCPLFAHLMKASLFNSQTSGQIVSSLRDLDSVYKGVLFLVKHGALNKDNLDDLLARPALAIETAMQINIGLDRSSRNRLGEREEAGEWFSHPVYGQVKAMLDTKLQQLNLANSENNRIVRVMNLADVLRILVALGGLHQGILYILQTQQRINIQQHIPMTDEGTQSFIRECFDEIIKHPKQGLAIVKLHFILKGRGLFEEYQARFSNLDQLPEALWGIESLDAFQLCSRPNLDTFLSENVPAMAAALAKAPFLDQAKFDVIANQVRSGYVPHCLIVDSGFGLRSRHSWQPSDRKY
jgi:hypothetical protein